MNATKMSKRMKRYRFIRKVSACSRAYFWAPCILCGREYGGNEWLKSSNGPNISSIPIPQSEYEGKCICPVCILEGKGYDRHPL